MSARCKFSLHSLSVLLLMLLLAVPAFAGHGDKVPEKKGILLVAFGTSEASAQIAFTSIQNHVKRAFPGTDVRWAYTSRIIRDKLAKQNGEQLDSTAEALAKMLDDEYTEVAVQSLHTIPGEEFHNMLKVVNGFRTISPDFRIIVGAPLLSTHDDLLRTRDAVLSIIPKERKNDEAVILMGHGTHHPANVYYPGMQYMFWQKDPNVFVGTVEGAPALDDILKDLKARKIKKAWLLPFMSVAGDHAKNDMAGPEDDSWKTVLEANGIKCTAVLKGTAEYPAIAKLWVEHLKQAMNHFE